jgi:hypothetical protein
MNTYDSYPTRTPDPAEFTNPPAPVDNRPTVPVNPPPIYNNGGQWKPEGEPTFIWQGAIMTPDDAVRAAEQKRDMLFRRRLEAQAALEAAEAEYTAAASVALRAKIAQVTGHEPYTNWAAKQNGAAE